MARLAIVRRVLAPMRVTVDDFEGASFVLRGPTGATELVDNLFDLWRRAEALGKRRIDPLDDAHLRDSAMSGRIPLHVLTGFLGSGKTTLLNRVLRDPAWSDSAVLINEIGAVSIDHDLVERMESGDRHRHRRAEGRLHLLRAARRHGRGLRELYARRADGSVPPFARVVMETTGLADPAPVLFTLAADPALRHKFERGAVVATFDAVHGLAQLVASSGDAQADRGRGSRRAHQDRSRRQRVRRAQLADAIRDLNPAAAILDVRDTATPHGPAGAGVVMHSRARSRLWRS